MDPRETQVQEAANTWAAMPAETAFEMVKAVPKVAGPWTLHLKGRCPHWIRFFPNGEEAAKAWHVPGFGPLWQWEARRINPEVLHHRPKYVFIDYGGERSLEEALACCDKALASDGCRLVGGIPADILTRAPEQVFQ